MLLVIVWLVALSQHYHVFGTDRTGNSVLVFALMLASALAGVVAWAR